MSESMHKMLRNILICRGHAAALIVLILKSESFLNLESCSIRSLDLFRLTHDIVTCSKAIETSIFYWAKSDHGFH